MRLTAGPDDAGLRLDVFLAEPLGSRARAQRLIDEGRVRVDGAPAPKRHRLAAGAVVEVDEAAGDEAVAGAPAPHVDVLFEDDWLLVVDKPPGLVVHPGAGTRPSEPTLVDALAGRIAGGADPARPGIVHRLDRDTSGLMVVARAEQSHQALQEALRGRAITREYLALVEGRPPARTGTIDAPLGRDRRVRTRMSTDTDDPRDAVTHFAIEQGLSEVTLLRVRLETGRTHQIRAHLAAIGHPVCGDPEYGTPGRLDLRRQFLHAARIAFAHPVAGTPVEVSSPLPADLVAALRAAGG